jgi:hypothetical protein
MWTTVQEAPPPSCSLSNVTSAHLSPLFSQDSILVLPFRLNQVSYVVHAFRPTFCKQFIFFPKHASFPAHVENLYGIILISGERYRLWSVPLYTHNCLTPNGTGQRASSFTPLRNEYQKRVNFFLRVYEFIWGSGGVTLLILNFGTIRRYVASLTSRPF